MSQSVSEQYFQMQVPFSFIKKLFKEMLSNFMADQEIIDKLNQLWIDIERQQTTFLKAYLRQLVDSDSTSAMNQFIEHFSDEFFEDLQLEVNEYADLLKEVGDLNSELADIDNELSHIDEQLNQEVEKQFIDNTSFSNDKGKVEPSLLREYIAQIDMHITERANSFANQAVNVTDSDWQVGLHSSIDSIMSHLIPHLNENSALDPHVSSPIAKRQLTDKVLGKPGDVHHELIKQKFTKAYHKAVCLNKIQNKTSKLLSIEEAALLKCKNHNGQGLTQNTLKS